MNKSFLVTRPEHDDTTHYLSHWAQIPIDLAKRKGIQVIDCRREKANADNVSSILSKREPSLVFLNGHGGDASVTGHKMEELVIKGKNEQLLNGKIVYALSCNSAKELGPASIKSGTKTYIGYDDEFIFVYNPLKITTPLKDETAALFLEPSTEVIISLLKENSCYKAKENSRHMFIDRINKLLTSETTKEDTSMVRYLWWDMTHQVLHGDGEAVF
jgi:hypothetical protein